MLSLPLSSPIPCSYQLPKPLSLSITKPRLHVSIKDQFSGDENTSPEEPILTPTGIRRELMPKHVAIIMDGNRRWARSRRLMPQAGYLEGARALKVVMDLCCKWGIQVLTVFAFSSDNWSRPKIEVDLLLGLLGNKVKDEIAFMEKENIRLSVMGDVSKLPESLREFIKQGEHITKNNSRLNLVIAMNYSGKHDIVQACKNVALKVKDGEVLPEEINELMIDNELGLKSMQLPHPDLLIRTSGEVRVSDFFLWQLAYTELYFTETLWPDFGEDELLRALQSPEEPIGTPAGLHRELMPKHVAVIMDGNRRWARSRGLMPQAGYLAGAGALKVVVDLCRNWGIHVLTVFAFSSDNWLRPRVEVDFLMGLLESTLKDEVASMSREEIRLSVIGDVSKLPKSLRNFITHCENTTKDNSGLNLAIAINYSGKYDIVQACQSIAQKVKDGVVEPEEINEFMIDDELGGMNLMRFPDPDLLIRTSGEVRVSNFFLWQLAYTELYFTEILWPDFGEDELLRALHAFQQRGRRYGG
ncbi:hypothetical protein LXL04_000125 [Taraxacum kok-saghyz]